MPGFDFLFGTDTVPMLSQPSGRGGQQFGTLDDARKSYLSDSGSISFGGFRGTPKQVYDQCKSAGASRETLKELVEKHGLGD